MACSQTLLTFLDHEPRGVSFLCLNSTFTKIKTILIVACFYLTHEHCHVLANGFIYVRLIMGLHGCYAFGFCVDPFVNVLLHTVVTAVFILGNAGSKKDKI